MGENRELLHMRPGSSRSPSQHSEVVELRPARPGSGASVGAPPSLRDEFREKVRNRVLDTAAAAAVEHGWQQLRMTELARTTGVARSTVFREFGTKHGLARALVAREADRLLGEIARALAHSRSWDVGLLGAFRATLRAREASPLLAAVLSTDHDDAALLSFLTVRSAPILAEARRLLSTYLRAHHPPRPDVVLEDAVDTLVRAAVSYVLVPELDRDDTAERLLGLAHRLLAAPLDHLAPAHRSSRPG